MRNTTVGEMVIGIQADQVPGNTGGYSDIGLEQAIADEKQVPASTGSTEVNKPWLAKAGFPQRQGSNQALKSTPKTGGESQAGRGAAQQNHAAQVPSAATAVPKLSREQRREVNRLNQQRIQIQEIAEHHKPPPNLTLKVEMGGNEVALADIPRQAKGGKAKRITAVEAPGVNGRPSEYTVDEGAAICAWITQGNSLNKYCIATGRKHETVYRWMRERPDFQAMYSQAHEDRADTLVDQMVEIADDSQHAQSMEAVTAARLRVDTRKWIASKMRQSKYGDKVEVRQTGSISIRLGIGKATAVELPLVDDVTPQLPG